MTVRLVLATIVGACGGYIIVAGNRTQFEIVTGLGLLFTCLALIVDHRY